MTTRCVQIGTTLVQGEYKSQQSKPFMRGDELFATVFTGPRSYTGKLVPSVRKGSTTVVPGAHNANDAGSNPAPSTKYRNHHDEIAAAIRDNPAAGNRDNETPC